MTVSNNLHIEWMRGKSIGLVMISNYLWFTAAAGLDPGQRWLGHCGMKAADEQQSPLSLMYGITSTRTYIMLIQNNQPGNYI